MVNFIPHGWTEGNLPLNVISRFSIADRKLVICEYGFMVGVFDYLTGGKITDINITDYPGQTNQEYIKMAIWKSNSVIDHNPNWIEVLNKLPIIN